MVTAIMKASQPPLFLMTCKICNTRRPRRFCPGVEGDICTVCCATEREVTVSCPLTCKYLIESRDTAKPGDDKDLPHGDLMFSPSQASRAQPFIILIASVLSQAAREQPALLDTDVRAALESLVQTYRTQVKSGLVLESRPDNPYAAVFHRRFQELIEEMRQEWERDRVGTLDDRIVLPSLAFLHRLAISLDNGRPKGRAFIHWLYMGFKPVEKAVEEPRLII